MRFDHGHAIHEVSRYGTKNSRSSAKNETFTVKSQKIESSRLNMKLRFVVSETK